MVIIKGKPSVNNNKKTTINLNGQRYNALSGQPLDRQKPVNIDGFIKSSLVQPKESTASVIKSTNQRQINHLQKKPHPSKTLMRGYVSKPSKQIRQISKISAPLVEIQKPSAINSPVMIGTIDTKIAKRARTINKNSNISRFGSEINRTNRPAMAREAAPSKLSAPLQEQPITKDINLFDQAIQNATAHEQPKLTKKELRKLHGRNPRKGRIISYLAIGTMGLAVIGFAVYKNIPNVMVKVASVRAGFAANLPSYRPSGYSLEAVGYSAGLVKLNFKSNLGNSKYTLTEHSSNWDSATLVSSILVPTTGNNYKKLMISGQNVYLYGKDQAAWVNNGIWYQVSGNGALSTNQIIKLATTL